MGKKSVKDYAYIIRGSQRKAVMMVMENMMTPTEICDKAKQINPKLSLNNCSDVLRDFRENEYVEVLNPKEKTGRLYELTDKGKKVKKMLNQRS